MGSFALQMKIRSYEKRISALEAKLDLVTNLSIALAGDRKGAVGEARLALVPESEEEQEAS